VGSVRAAITSKMGYSSTNFVGTLSRPQSTKVDQPERPPPKKSSEGQKSIGDKYFGHSQEKKKKQATKKKPPSKKQATKKKPTPKKPDVVVKPKQEEFRDSYVNWKNYGGQRF